MIQINVLVDHMGPSQLAYYLTRNFNELADTRQDVDTMVFFNLLNTFGVLPKFACMQMAEAWGQPGFTIATTTALARQLLTFPGPEKKAFYVWDLEWARGNRRQYSLYCDVCCNRELILIARNEIHAKAIQNCFNREKIYVVDNFNCQQLLEVIESERTNTRDRAA